MKEGGRGGWGEERVLLEEVCVAHTLKISDHLHPLTASHTYSYTLQRMEEVVGGPSGRKED